MPVPPAVTAVGAQTAAILTDITRFLARRGRVTLPHILTPLANVLTNVAPVAADVTAVVADVAPVAPHFMTISVRI